MYRVIVLPKAQKFIKGLDRNIKNRILTVLVDLAAEPRPTGCIKMKNEDGVWRIRVDDYRIGYSIEDATQIITILRIGHRSDFYSS